MEKWKWIIYLSCDSRGIFSDLMKVNYCDMMEKLSSEEMKESMFRATQEGVNVQSNATVEKQGKGKAL